MFLKQEYGPNTAQVRRFIDRLRALTASDWEQVRAAEARARAAYGSPNSAEIQVAAIGEYGQDHEEKLLNPATKQLDFVTGFDRYLAAEAVMALVLCDIMTPMQFAAWYGPFAELIPVESLGKGKAPSISGAPETILGRFVARVRSLEAPEWQQVVRTAIALQDAVGVDAVDAALEAASFSEARADEADRRAREVSGLIESIDSIGEDYMDKLDGALKGVGRVIKREDFADSYVQSIEMGLENYKTAAARALFGLAARDYMPPQQFAMLYLPFAGLIPVESLEIRRNPLAPA